MYIFAISVQIWSSQWIRYSYPEIYLAQNHFLCAPSGLRRENPYENTQCLGIADSFPTTVLIRRSQISSSLDLAPEMERQESTIINPVARGRPKD